MKAKVRELKLLLLLIISMWYHRISDENVVEQKMFALISVLKKKSNPPETSRIDREELKCRRVGVRTYFSVIYYS